MSMQTWPGNDKTHYTPAMLSTVSAWRIKRISMTSSKEHGMLHSANKVEVEDVDDKKFAGFRAWELGSPSSKRDLHLYCQHHPILDPHDIDRVPAIKGLLGHLAMKLSIHRPCLHGFHHTVDICHQGSFKPSCH